MVRKQRKQRRCPRWCARPTDHDGRHHRVVSEVVGSETTVSLFLHALPPEREPTLAISIGFANRRPFSATTLSWESADELIRALGMAVEDYKP